MQELTQIAGHYYLLIIKSTYFTDFFSQSLFIYLSEIPHILYQTHNPTFVQALQNGN